MSEESAKAAANLDRVLANLQKNFSEGVDYFQLLVERFQAVLLRDENKYLRHFFMILPALTINFVETSRVAKDRMQRLKAGGRNRANVSDAYFTDDGFALGCAFIMTTLKLGKRFDALHWFDTLKTKFDTEAQSIDATRRATKKSDKDALTELQLKTQRVAIYQVGILA